MTVRSRLARIVGWLALGIGLTMYWLAPRLEIANQKFIVPARLASSDGVLYPQKLVARERVLKFACAVSMLFGTIALGGGYRTQLFPFAARSSVDAVRQRAGNPASEQINQEEPNETEKTKG
jgi:hypothetical protein